MIEEKGLITENELMLGDWIYLTEHKTNARVTALRSTDPDVVLVTDKGEVEMRIDMRSIPLTEEILLENGFKPNRFVSCGYYVLIPVKGMSRQLSVTIRDNVFRVSFSAEIGRQSIDVIKQDMSVHELQHVMRLCGIEKEVVL